MLCNFINVSLGCIDLSTSNLHTSIT
jgi:hypothetical protein